jgi:hypothetical protein
MNGYICNSTGNADIKFINGLVGKLKNRKPWFLFSRKSWDFPVKIFPAIRCDLMATSGGGGRSKVCGTQWC